VTGGGGGGGPETQSFQFGNTETGIHIVNAATVAEVCVGGVWVWAWVWVREVV